MSKLEAQQVKPTQGHGSALAFFLPEYARLFWRDLHRARC